VNDEIYLSVVIPAYNEELRIGRTLEKITVFLRKQPYASEIILSDDGCKDRTVDAASAGLIGFPSHQILRNARNRGKGAVVKDGMLAGKGKYLLFTDADLSTPIEEVTGFLKTLSQEGYDIVIGSRGLGQSRVEIRQNILRQSMGKIFNCMARLLSFRGIKDSQCGFKCFSREAAQNLFKRQKIQTFSFDVEIIYLAQRLGYRILEAPVIWRNSPNSRVHILRDSALMFLDLLRIRWLHGHEK
jgi:dolichyl-phosphate beta-glucosyltransferase